MKHLQKPFSLYFEKDLLKSFGILCGLFMTLTACDANNIDTSEGRLLPEPDKELRIASEIKQSLSGIAAEITDSDQIETCKSGRKLIGSGTEILPYLKAHFSDSTDTRVYSDRNKRTLTIGEIAIIAASEIKPIPIARVVGIQQCTPPFDLDIESYLWNIQKRHNDFKRNYDEWLKDEKQ
ncbi:hypothetical protein [uncultured Fluviicola sp.]|uniref:hypothetical protein n=1 Tax=uncultured Fluviicola sp. TaxID=463303 RepID=UPI0025FEC97B|nr:hypothetical protein [uncultured Fluviicola sp.]